MKITMPRNVAFVAVWALCASNNNALAFQPSNINAIQRQSSQARLSSPSWGMSSSQSLRLHAHDNVDNESIDGTNRRHNSPTQTLAYYSTLLFTTATLMLAPLNPNDSMAWAASSIAPATEQSTLLQTSPVVKQKESVVEEAWNLVNKYFIDRTFNDQDWNSVHNKYTQLAKNANNDRAMELTTEMVNSLGDKYSRMLDAEKYAAIQKFDLIGVGVTLMPNAQKQIIVGAPPIDKSPSQKAGLEAGDLVTSINGLTTTGRNAFDIIDQISENPGAKTVTFAILRQGDNDLAGEGKTFEVTMERMNAMEIKDPIYYKISETRKDGTKVGYIRVSEFNSLVKGKLEEALADLKSQGANAYVMDLRMNTGGAFQSAVEISSLFLEDRVATYVIDSNQVELPFRTASSRLAIDPKDPMVIWMDGLTASASEVLAGSLHDNCRAVTMGSKSFGKGLIQAVYGMKNGAGLVLTVARYVTPAGTEIQGIGLTPDIEGNVPPPPIVPVISSDTSRVDFQEISKRLDPAMCKVPEVHATRMQ